MSYNNFTDYWVRVLADNFDPEEEFTRIWVHSDYYLYGYDGKYTITQSIIGPTVKISGSVATTNFYSYNSKRYYTNSSQVIWYDTDKGWVISSALGHKIYESWDEENEEYTGDVWYSSQSESLTGDYYARGSLRGTTQDAYEGTAVTVTSSLDGWQSDSLAGVYEAVEGASGTKIVGWKQYDYSGAMSGTVLETSGMSNGKPVYKPIDGSLYLWDNDGEWILSAKSNSAVASTGYWRKSGEIEGSYSRMYEGEASDPFPGSISVSFDDYSSIGENTDILMFNVARWL